MFWISNSHVSIGIEQCCGSCNLAIEQVQNLTFRQDVESTFIVPDGEQAPRHSSEDFNEFITSPFQLHNPENREISAIFLQEAGAYSHEIDMPIRLLPRQVGVVSVVAGHREQFLANRAAKPSRHSITLACGNIVR